MTFAVVLNKESRMCHGKPMSGGQRAWILLLYKLHNLEMSLMEFSLEIECRKKGQFVVPFGLYILMLSVLLLMLYQE